MVPRSLSRIFILFSVSTPAMEVSSRRSDVRRCPSSDFTGIPQGLLSIPDDDFYTLSNGLDAINDPDSGNWYWPCESTLMIDMNGSQGRVYTIQLADPTQPYSETEGYCASRIDGPGIGANDWSVSVIVRQTQPLTQRDRRLLGLQFMVDYYMILEYRSNLLGFATKNVDSSAATTSVLTGSG